MFVEKTVFSTVIAWVAGECSSVLTSESRVGCGEGKRRNEFAEWHVAWLAE